MLNLIPWWLRYGVTAGAAFAFAWWIQGLRWDASLLDQANATIDAQHAGWVASTERWAARDLKRAEADRKNELELAALRARVSTLRRAIDHAVLVSPDQAIAVCPDPRGPEWLRLYNAGAAGGPQGPAAGAPDRVSTDSP